MRARRRTSSGCIFKKAAASARTKERMSIKAFAAFTL